MHYINLVIYYIDVHLKCPAHLGLYVTFSTKIYSYTFVCVIAIKYVHVYNHLILL